MSIVIPTAAVNYQSPLVAVPDVNQNSPKEGMKLISCEVDWGVTDKGNGAVYFNLQNNATLEFSQICGLVVDNSVCGADLEFVFPDTSTTIGVPAYAPYTVIPVFSHQTQFYVVAIDSELSTDITRFNILNYNPLPVAVPTSAHQAIVSANSISLTGAGSTIILPTTVNGTIEGLNILLAVNKPTAAFNDLLQLRDGANNLLWSGNVAGDTTNAGYTTQLIGMSNLGLRFKQGLVLNQTGAVAPGGTIDVNVYYRAP